MGRCMFLRLYIELNLASFVCFQIEVRVMRNCRSRPAAATYCKMKK
jgi:hypothetical protein